ncbi:MAG TPA: VOC family protein [Syntrophorhabdaceae bacterium]|nr:VOC family protein [Syntrophorhabdaceae bacterium]HOL05102.1 VOC family protein [Syntrophorhabdaceae bacterium]HPP41587.1 VOC family protein [Syntrophorhabdaceae bacterium]
MRLNHIGIIVKDIEEYKRLFYDIGLHTTTEPATDPIQKVTGLFIDVGFDNNVHIELLEPVDDTSPVTNFLKKKGGGLHHLCFEVDDIQKKTEEFKKKGFKVVSPPVECIAYDENFKRACATHTKIAFFMASDRMLIELIEKGK